MPKHSLNKKIRESVIAVLEKHGAERIAVFGSYARGEAGKKSDIDLLVRFRTPKSLIQLVQIEDEIKKATRTNVDLVTENAVSPYLAGPIRRDEVVIFG